MPRPHWPPSPTQMQPKACLSSSLSSLPSSWCLQVSHSRLVTHWTGDSASQVMRTREWGEWGRTARLHYKTRQCWHLAAGPARGGTLLCSRTSSVYNNFLRIIRWKPQTLLSSDQQCSVITLKACHSWNENNPIKKKRTQAQPMPREFNQQYWYWISNYMMGITTENLNYLLRSTSLA